MQKYRATEPSSHEEKIIADSIIKHVDMCKLNSYNRLYTVSSNPVNPIQYICSETAISTGYDLETVNRVFNTLNQHDGVLHADIMGLRAQFKASIADNSNGDA